MRSVLVVFIVISLSLALRAELRQPSSGLARAHLRHGTLLLTVRSPDATERAALTCRVLDRPVAVRGYWFPPGRARGQGAGPDDALGGYALPAPAECQLDLTGGAEDPRSYCIDRDARFSAAPCAPPLVADLPAHPDLIGRIRR